MDTFQLQWNQFQNNLATSLKTLRLDRELYDVTLACDDGQVEAHKLVLCAGSSFLKKIILKNPHPHPLFYLKGIKMEDLTSMMDFMYLGKTNVEQIKVETFLTLGEDFGIEGLVKNQEKQNVSSIQYATSKRDDDIKVEGDNGIFNDPRIPLSISNNEIDDTFKPLNSTYDIIEHKLNNVNDFSDLHLNETNYENLNE